MAQIGVLVSGCGFRDGAEIHESVVTLLALLRHGHQIVPLAPAIAQRQVLDHVTGKAVKETRNVRTEAARIFRAAPNTPDQAGELDGLILPGGFGAVTNLCDFATKGTDCTVEPSTAALVRSIVDAHKPLGAWCIAPALVAAVLRGKPQVQMTIGNDVETAQKLEAMGVEHVNCDEEACVVDYEHKIVTTPAYMLGKNVLEISKGIDKAIEAFGKFLEH